jgi:hypothetical protein
MQFCGFTDVLPVMHSVKRRCLVRFLSHVRYCFLINLRLKLKRHKYLIQHLQVKERIAYVSLSVFKRHSPSVLCYGVVYGVGEHFGRYAGFDPAGFQLRRVV